MSCTLMSGMLEPVRVRRLLARSLKFSSTLTSFSISQLMSRKSMDSAPRSWLREVVGEIVRPSMFNTALIAVSTQPYSS